MPFWTLLTFWAILTSFDGFGHLAPPKWPFRPVWRFGQGLEEVGLKARGLIDQDQANTPLSFFVRLIMVWRFGQGLEEVGLDLRGLIDQSQVRTPFILL